MAIEPIKGFYVHDEATDTDGVAKVDATAVEGVGVPILNENGGVEGLSINGVAHKYVYDALEGEPDLTIPNEYLSEVYGQVNGLAPQWLAWENGAFNTNGKIEITTHVRAPLSSGTYQFIIENGYSYSLVYYDSDNSGTNFLSFTSEQHTLTLERLAYISIRYKDTEENPNVLGAKLTILKIVNNDINTRVNAAIQSSSVIPYDTYSYVDYNEEPGYFRNGSISEGSNWYHTIIDVSPGEIYKISCYGNAYVAPYYFCDNSLSVISYPTISTSTVYSDLIITIPNGVTKLALNYNNVYASMNCAKVVKQATFNNLKGKTIVNFGDSIFANYDNGSVSQLLSSMSEATVYNCAFGGCRMALTAAEPYKWFSMVALTNAICDNDFTNQETHVSDSGVPQYYKVRTLPLLKSINFNNVDIITIAYGTNDYTGGTVINDTESGSDTNTYVGALKYVINRIQTSFPHIKIVVLSPIWRFFEDNTDSDNNNYAGTGTLKDYVSALVTTCESLRVPVLNAYVNMSLSKSNATTYLNDTVHLNMNGRKMYAELINGKLTYIGE